MVKYYLMHKNTKCGMLLYDETTDRIVKYHDYQTGASPFLGNADAAKIKKWWEMRAIPASRSALSDMLKNAGCTTAGHYLAKNLALSMTDSYWICPEDSPLTYEEVRFMNLAAFHEGKVPYHNATSYNPNASLGGQMDKYWDLGGEIPLLAKESYRFYGQQAVNEAFATMIHTRQDAGIPFVKYQVSATVDRGMICKCPTFTSETSEFISAYEVIESQKTSNEKSLYDGYIDTCVMSGIDRGIIQDFMDYQSLTDFIISNDDEHLQNFGILRNSDTMKIIGPAPIFDSGNSMFYADDKKIPYTRSELLERKVTSFFRKEEQILKKIQNKKIVRLDLLPDAQEVKNFFEGFNIPEQKADFISHNYELKLQLTKEFQNGKTISLYHEKQKEKQNNKTKNSCQNSKFFMLCGLPGTGKTKEAQEMLEGYRKAGIKVLEAEKFFSVKDAIKKSEYFLDAQTILNNINPAQELKDMKNVVTLVSLNEIKDQIRNNRGMGWDDLAFVTAEAQIKAALMSDTTVIYDASNLSRDTRKEFVKIAKEAGTQELVLKVMSGPGKEGASISEDTLRMMKLKFDTNEPTMEEGWTEILVKNDAELQVEEEEYRDSDER